MPFHWDCLLGAALTGRYKQVKRIIAVRGAICVVIAAVLTAMAGAQLTDTSATAAVNVQPALTLTMVASPSWGKVVAPASGTATYALDYSTGAVTVVSGDGYAFDNGQIGSYSVTGAAGAPISFSVAIGAFSGSGISVVSGYINGYASSGTASLDVNGDLTLKVGGEITVASTATVANQTATVTVTIDYQ